MPGEPGRISGPLKENGNRTVRARPRRRRSRCCSTSRTAFTTPRTRSRPRSRPSRSRRASRCLAGVLNFVGAYLSLPSRRPSAADHRPERDDAAAILAGLVGAITWNLVTWWRGLPTSSSHALIGGVAGAAIASTGGFDVVNWGRPRDEGDPSRRIYVPLLGFGLAALLALCLAGRVGRYLDARPTPLRGLQLVSAGFVALTHGTNDAQKTMGVIALALVVSGDNAAFAVDDWVIFARGARDRARHLRRRLAHRPHPRPAAVRPRPARRASRRRRRRRSCSGAPPTSASRSRRRR